MRGRAGVSAEAMTRDARARAPVMAARAATAATSKFSAEYPTAPSRNLPTWDQAAALTSTRLNSQAADISG